MDSLRGQLLVAAPSLLDPNFARAVVLVCEHNEDGALGLVLNRRTDISVGVAVPELGGLIDPDERLWGGGPVQQSSIVVLAELEEPGDALMVNETIGLVLEGADMAALEQSPGRARAFLGYAGWGAGQLESELETDDWIVAPGHPDDAFFDDPSTLWSVALERMGGEYALLASFPPDPTLN
jgi:putative transcriptional regulator